GSVSSPDQDMSILARAATLDPGDPEHVGSSIAALRESEQRVKAVAGSNAETSRQIALLLEAALKFHSGHGDGDCPVCGTKAGLTQNWAESSRKEVARLQSIAHESSDAHRAAGDALRKAKELLPTPPRLLAQLRELD